MRERLLKVAVFRHPVIRNQVHTEFFIRNTSVKDHFETGKKSAHFPGRLVKNKPVELSLRTFDEPVQRHCYFGYNFPHVDCLHSKLNVQTHNAEGDNPP